MKATLRKLISASVIGCYGLTVLAQDPHSEGVAAGNSANVLIRGMLNQPTAASVLPPGYYNSNPSEAGLYSQQSLSAATAARVAYCNSAVAVDDITCQA